MLDPFGALSRRQGAAPVESTPSNFGRIAAQNLLGTTTPLGRLRGQVHTFGELNTPLIVTYHPAYLLRNDGGNKNRWLRVRTVGTRSNRDGIGARVTVTLPDGRKPWAVVKTGSSYLSQNELPLTFGLGAHAKAARVEVAWPSGATDVLSDVAANQSITVEEGKGLVR